MRRTAREGVVVSHTSDRHESIVIGTVMPG